MPFNRFKKDAQQLSKGVDKECEVGLPSYFRDLTEKEEALSKTGCALPFGSYWSYSWVCISYLLDLVLSIFLLFLDDCIVGRLLHFTFYIVVKISWRSSTILRELGCTIPMVPFNDRKLFKFQPSRTWECHPMESYLSLTTLWPSKKSE